jgi:hypothetical protein
MSLHFHRLSFDGPDRYSLDHRNLHFHRWCQWMSRHHPAGVYAGQESKVAEYKHSLPPLLAREILRSLANDSVAVVLLGKGRELFEPVFCGAA